MAQVFFFSPRSEAACADSRFFDAFVAELPPDGDDGLSPALAVTVNGDHLELRDGGGGTPLRLIGQTQAGLTGPWTDVRPTLVAGTTWRIRLALADGRGFARLAFEDP